ncbi:MAG: sigma-70 family RNA polymerase sigma factor [Thomasclavelia sp.]|nr:sigma-70 family RNA polymerase sigma factor [Thomasclavelia sp.]
MENIDIKNQNNIINYLNGNDDAFSMLYEDNYKAVYFMAYNFFYNEELAYDLTQDVFIKVHKYLDKLENKRAFRLWIKRITYTTCLKEAKKRKGIIVELNDQQSIEDFSDDKSYIEDEFKDILVLETIEKELKELPFHYKAVAVLRYYDDLKISEISQILEIPEGTVKSRLSIVNKTLKTSLTNEGLTPNMKYGSIPFGILQTAYLALEANSLLSNDNANKIFSTITGVSATAVGISIAAKAVISVAIIGSLVVGGNAIKNSQTTNTNNSMNPTMVVAPTKIDNTLIKDITYDTSYVNHEVNVNVSTTNQNYKAILINNVNTKQVVSNGTYTVTIINNEDKVMDTKTITVSNIDLAAPTGTVTKTNSTHFTISLKDDVSGINYDAITLTRNGTLIHDYSINRERGTISFNSPNGVNDVLNIYDNAGNFRTYNFTDATE